MKVWTGVSAPSNGYTVMVGVTVYEPFEWQAVHTCWLPGAPVRSLFCCSATPLWWDIKVRANAAEAKVTKTLVRKVAGTIFIIRQV
jgi:hypothetical protein